VGAWIKQHPYLTGSLVLGLLVLYLILRGARSGGGTSTVIQSGGASDALQAAQLQATVQGNAIQAGADVQNNALAAALAAKSIDASTTLGVAGAQRDVALAGINAGAETADTQTAALLASNQAAFAADLQKTAIQTGGQVSIANTVAGAQVQIAGIQAPVQMAAIDAAVKTQADIDKTSVDLATINEAGAVTINGQNTARDTNVAQIQGNTLFGIADLQAGVQNNMINSETFLQGKALDIQGTLDQNTIEAHSAAINQFFQSLNSGVFNKGGEGGQNQTQVTTSLFGTPTPGATPGSPVAGFGSFLAGLGQALFGGAKLAAAVP
jgi:hypothetical protein